MWKSLKLLWVVDVVLAENKEQINSKQDWLESGEMRTVPSKLEVVVVDWGWMRVGLQRWYWGQFVEVGRDVEVLGVEVDLHEERGEEHCNIHAIEGREFRGEHSWPWHSREEPPMG